MRTTGMTTADNDTTNADDAPHLFRPVDKAPKPSIRTHLTRLSRLFRRSSTGDLARVRRTPVDATTEHAASDSKTRRCVSMAATPLRPPLPCTMRVVDAEVVLTPYKNYAAVSSHGARSYNEDRFRVVTHLERYADSLLQCDPQIADLDQAVEAHLLEGYAATGDAPNVTIEPLLALDSTTNTEFFGVFDGHGGDACSTFLALQFPLELLRAPEFPTDVAVAAEHACSALNEEFHQREAKQHTGAGSTALTLMIRDNVAYLCNIGDCRAIVVSSSEVQALTTDHKAGEASEKKRIEESGGMVLFINGVPRVNGLLAVSRAFGDVELSEHVIARPEITRHELKPSDEFIVLGSDGLWDALTNEDVQSCLHSYPWMTLEEITQLLVDRAIEEGSYDNVTCVVVDLRDPKVVAENFL